MSSLLYCTVLYVTLPGVDIIPRGMLKVIGVKGGVGSGGGSWRVIFKVAAFIQVK